MTLEEFCTEYNIHLIEQSFGYTLKQFCGGYAYWGVKNWDIKAPVGIVIEHNELFYLTQFDSDDYGMELVLL